MPRRLHEDEYTVTMQGDNGEVFSVAKPTADKLFPTGAPDFGQTSYTDSPGGGGGPRDPVPPVALTEPGYETGVDRLAPIPGSPHFESSLAVTDAPGLAPDPATSPPRSLGSVTGPAPPDFSQGPQQPPPSVGVVPQAEPLHAQPAPVVDDSTFAGPGDDIDMHSAAVDAQRFGARQQAAAEAQGQERTAAAFGGLEERMAEQERARAEQEAADQAETQRRIASIDADIKAVAESEIDRGRLWKNLSTGKKVLAGISVALSGLGMALKGKGEQANPALGMLMGAIEADVQDQMVELDKMKEGVGLKRGALGLHLQQSNSRQEAYHRTMAFYTDQAARMVSKISAETNSEAIRAKGQIVEGQLVEEYAKHVQGAERYQREWDYRVQRDQEAARARRAGLGLQARGMRLRERAQAHSERMDAFKAQQAIEASRAKASEANAQGVLIDPVTGAAMGTSRFGKIDKKEAVSDQNAVDAYVRYRSGLADYYTALRVAKRVYQGPGGSSKWLQSQAAKDLESMHVNLATDLAKAKNGGRVSDQDVAQAMKIIPGPQSMGQRSDPKQIVKRLMREGDRGHASYLTGRGIDKTNHSVITSMQKNDDFLNAPEPKDGPDEKAFKLTQQRQGDPDETSFVFTPTGPVPVKRKHKQALINPALAAGSEAVEALLQPRQRRAVDFMAKRAKGGNQDSLVNLRAAASAPGAIGDYARKALSELE